MSIEPSKLSATLTRSQLDLLESGEVKLGTNREKEDKDYGKYIAYCESLSLSAVGRTPRQAIETLGR